MADKQFWSGAIIVATVVIAGAGALPTLLLAPGSSGPVLTPAAPKPQVAAAAVETKHAPAEPKAEAVGLRVELQPLVESKPARLAAPEPALSVMVVPQPEPARAELPPPPAEIVPLPPPRVAEASPPPAAPIPEPMASVPLRQALPVEFPPVQPVGVPGLRRDLPAAKSAPAQNMGGPLVQPPRRAAAKAQPQKRRPVRPAPYPLREFFAYRR